MYVVTTTKICEGAAGVRRPVCQGRGRCPQGKCCTWRGCDVSPPHGAGAAHKKRLSCWMLRCSTLSSCSPRFCTPSSSTWQSRRVRILLVTPMVLP